MNTERVFKKLKYIPVVVAAMMSASVAQVAVAEDTLTTYLLEAGPFGSGVSTLEFVDSTRSTPANGDAPELAERTLPITVWYPASDPSSVGEAQATPAKAPFGGHFPLIIAAHGLAGLSSNWTYMGEYLASHGYIVAALNFPASNAEAAGGPNALDVPNQVLDLQFLLESLQQEVPFAELIDMTRVGLLGHSLGGLTVSLSEKLPAVDAVAMLSPAFCPGQELVAESEPLAVPSLLVHGTTDAITVFDRNAEPLFALSGEPKYLVAIDNGSHLGFVDSAPAIEATLAPLAVDTAFCLQGLFDNDPSAAACGTCENPPESAQLSAQRQLDLTRVTVRSFFDAHLRCNALGGIYLQHVAGHENQELAITFEGDRFAANRACIGLE